MNANIVAVDDTPANLRLLAGMLSQQGYKVRPAPNGERALATIRKDPPDLILLDIMMPDMDGYEVCRLLKADEATKDIPVIFMTALDSVEDKVKGFNAGGVDYVTKPVQQDEVLARVKVHLTLRNLQKQLQQSNRELETRNRFIRNTFGRYLSEEIVETILETPDGLSLGGENRTVTIMMTDLRGFTAISEQMSAEQTVDMLNTYFDIMTEIIFKFQGTIDEFIGDAILAVFGVPVTRDDDARRAVACALEMQLAMDDVNRRNREAGYPELAMGIGVHTGDVIVGNIGSHKRTKYGIVGRNVNLTSRIESYTVGGQTLISETTRTACGDLVRIDHQMEVMPKGVKQPVTVYEVGGIGGEYGVFLPEKPPADLLTLPAPISVTFTILDGKYPLKEVYTGSLTKLSNTVAEIQAQRTCRELTNLKLLVFEEQANRIITEDLYAKVTATVSDVPPTFTVHFTSVPPECQAFFQQLLMTA